MRRGVVLLAAVAFGSCSTDTATSSETLSPTTTALDATPATPPVASSPAPPEASTTIASTTTAAPTATDPVTSTGSTPSTEVAATLVGGPQGDFWLPLGYWDGSDWVQLGEESESVPLEFPAATGDAVRVTGLDLAPAATTLGTAGEACHEERIGFAVGVAAPTPDPPGFGYSAIAVAGDWEIQPRPTNQVGLQIDEYRQIGATFAAGLGLDGTAGEVVQVVRADLDGDGMEEVLVAFENTDSAIGEAGDYSIMYLRAPQIDGSVVDTVVVHSLVDPNLPDDGFPFMFRVRLLGVADLNGDGQMEVALHTWYYEGAGVSVYEFNGDGVTEVMSNGCGA